MTRGVLAALAGVLLLGALLDATTHRTNAGVSTLGEFRARQATEDGVARDRSVPTLVGTAATLGSRVEDSRYGLFLEIRARAPGAVLVVDERIPDFEVSKDLLRAMAASAESRSADLAWVRTPDVTPVSQGTYRYGDWYLYLAPGDASMLLIVDDGPSRLVVDARLVEDDRSGRLQDPAVPTAVAAPSARDADRPPTLSRAIVAESAVMLVLLLVGGLLIPRGAVRPMMIAPAALVVGVSLHAALGLLRLPGLWGLGVTSVVGLGIAVIARVRGSPTGWHSSSLLASAGFAVSVVAVVAWARWATFLVLTPDSWRYWSGGAAQADGFFRLQMFDVMRSPAQQPLHATGFALGIEGLQALGAVLLLAAAVLLVADTVPSLRSVGWRQAGRYLTVPVVLVLGLVISPQVRSMAAYLNPHLLVAVLLLMLAILLGKGTDRRIQLELLPAVTVVIAAIVLSRAEGAFLVGILLVGTLGVSGVRAPWQSAWMSLGGVTLVWAGVLAAGSGINTAVMLLGLAAVLSLGLGPLVAQVDHRFRRFAPRVVIGGLWAAVAVLSVAETDNFLEVVQENLGRGAGGWGVSGVLLLILAVAASAFSTGRNDLRFAPLRWFLIGFVPVVALSRAVGSPEQDLGRLLSSSSRVGWGDSVNRMWTHALLIVLLLLIREAAARVGMPASSPRADGHPSSGTRVRVTAVAVALGIAVAVQWQPTFDTRSEVLKQEILSTWGEEPFGELVAGAEVRQLVTPSFKSSGRSAGIPIRLCVAPTFVTYGRENFGSVDVILEGRGWSVEDRIDVGRLTDWGQHVLCADLQGELETVTADLSLTVRGVDGSPGSSVSLLEALEPAEFTTVRVADRHGALSSRFGRSMVVDVFVLLETSPGSRTFLGALDVIMSNLPWLAVALVAVLGGARSTGRRRVGPAQV